MTALDDLARRFVEWEAASEATAARTLDAAGAYLAGSATEEGRAISDHVSAWDVGVPGDVTQLVATIRMTELDDIHMPSCTTPGAVVVGTAVAVGGDAAAYARAVEVGYEAMTRLGRAIDGAHVVYRHTWPTYFAAPFAAAAVTASLLGLDAKRTSSALGLALTRATGLTSGIVGARLGRWLAVGDAARSGCAAAFAARNGFVADVDLERIGIDAASLQADGPPAVDEVSIKPFPVAKQSLAAAEAALRLGDAGPVRVGVPVDYAEMVGATASPDSRLSRLASARWNVALALVRPAALHDVERRADDAEIRDMADLVEVGPDATLSPLYPARFPALVEAGGRSETVIDAPGDPPSNDFEAVDRKWRERPEEVDEIRAAALAGDPARLRQLL